MEDTIIHYLYRRLLFSEREDMMNFIDFCTESEKVIVRKVRYSSNNNWVSAKRSYARRRRKTNNWDMETSRTR